MKFAVVSGGRVIIKNPPKALILDGKVYIFDAREKININAALNQGAYWRSTPDGLLLLIKDGEVILVTHRKGGHGKHGSGHGGGHSGWKKPRSGFDSEVEKAKRTSLHNFQTKSAEYANNLQKWKHISDEDRKEFETKLKALFDRSDFAFRRSARTVDRLLDGDHYKNQIELYEVDKEANSRGYWGPEERKKWSARLFGHSGKDKDGGELNGDDYEKYGVLVAPIEAKERAQAVGYGSCVVRLKKDRVKGRTTYTYGDSLGKDCIAGDADNPSLAGHNSWGLDNAMDIMKRMKGSPTVTHYVNESSSANYIELQFHGTITAKDIDSITYEDPMDLTERMYDKAREKGIKTYTKVNGEIKEVTNWHDYMLAKWREKHS